MTVELIVFLIAGAFAIIGALGVIRSAHPVHSALSLVMTLFAVAVLLLNQDAQFLAAVQVIVYAGAIVVLFLFVIMLLGVDEAEDLRTEPIVGQRFLAFVLAVAVLVLAVIPIMSADGATGVESVTAPKLESLDPGWGTETSAYTDLGPASETNPNAKQLGRVIFTDYVYAFEITALLLTIAVVGAVVMARRPRGEEQELPDPAPWTVEPVFGSSDDHSESAGSGEGH